VEQLHYKQKIKILQIPSDSYIITQMGKPLIPAQRREKIQEHLAIHQIARTADLMDLLEASEATVRRDLEWLEQKGILERTHGGAILNQRVIFEQEYQLRAKNFPEEKKSIGELAATLIDEGDIVFVNSGTTAAQVLQYIPRNPRITVFTNNGSALTDIGDPGFSLNMTGGEFQARSNSLSGRFALDNLSLVFANKAILGVDGISLKHGLTVPTNPEAEVVRKMIERTKGQVIIVSDHSKWGAVSNFHVGSIDVMDKLVTDSGFSKQAKKELAEYSIEVFLANGAVGK
jgi:DeoR/GlpR family transcriptional regulator of sugar metabolism